jgi:hypothetical protein
MKEPKWASNQRLLAVERIWRLYEDTALRVLLTFFMLPKVKIALGHIIFGDSARHPY